MLHHPVARHLALPGNSVNLMHSGDPRGAGMTRQQQSRVLQWFLLLAELLGTPGALLDSCLWTLQGKVRGSCLFVHTVSVEKGTSSHLAISFIFSLEDRFPRRSSAFLEELARRVSDKKKKEGELTLMWGKKDVDKERILIVYLLVCLGFWGPQYSAKISRDSKPSISSVKSAPLSQPRKTEWDPKAILSVCVLD